MKVILHMDLDSYFVSAERTLRPHLIGKPVIVAGRGKRTIVAAASYEAKAKGIYVPMPVYKAIDLIKDIVIIEPDYALYSGLSTKLFRYITEKYTDQIEIGSIDECYIDATDIWKKYGTVKKLAESIQSTVMEKFKLPVSIGISDNKFVAKMSTQINKPYGITITKPGKFLEVFGDWDINKFFGIGGAWSEKLRGIGIHKIGDLSTATVDQVKPVFGKNAAAMIEKANGVGSDEVVLESNELKSIGHMITFQFGDKSDVNSLHEVLYSLVEMVEYRAKTRNLCGNIVTVIVKEKWLPKKKSHSRQMKLDNPIYKKEDIFRVAKKLFAELWDESILKGIGITLSGLSSTFEARVQSSMFDKKEDKTKVETIIEDVNEVLGNDELITGERLEKEEFKEINQSKFIASDWKIHDKRKKTYKIK